MSTYIDMHSEVEYTSVSICRSKSHDDLLTIVESEIESSCGAQKKILFRQGAIRKRFPDIDVDLHKRNSVALEKVEMAENVAIFNDNAILRTEKRTKNSFASFTIVKEKWKSLKKDIKTPEKEEIKKRFSIVKMNSNHSCVHDYESFSPDIKVFLEKFGNKICESADESMLLMESSCEGLTDFNKMLTKSEVDQQAAIWEIIETEINFIKQLSIFVHVFHPILQNLITSYPVDLPGVDIDDLFGNINEVYLSHWTLWNCCISLPLSLAKIKKEPLDIGSMKTGFCTISKILESYNSFMRNLPTMRKTIQKLQKESSVFRQYTEWTQKYSRLCRDGHIGVLSLPFQRITRYKLLLERVRSLSCQEQHRDIDEMMINVHIFVQRMNSSIIGKYSMQDIKEKIVDCSMIKELSCDISSMLSEDNLLFDITRPLSGFKERILIHEGRLKLKECCNKLSDVECYLCNDLFMVCKPVKNNWNRLKIHKLPIRLDKLLVKEKADGSLVTIVFSDFMVIEGILIFAGGAEEVKLWVDKCTKAISAFVSQYSDSISLTLTSVCDSQEAIIPTQEDYSSDESLRRWKHSETNSSGHSTYSTDSAFSQTSGSSTQTDCSHFVARGVACCKSQSVEDLSMPAEGPPQDHHPDNGTLVTVTSEEEAFV